MDGKGKIRHLRLMNHEENIKRFLQEKIDDAGGVPQFSDLIKVAERTVYAWLSGERNISRNNLAALADQYNLEVRDIHRWGEVKAPDTGDYVAVPFVTQEAQGGLSGRAGADREVKSYLAFTKQWALSKGDPGRMEVMRVRGDSMEPTVMDGDVVLIDRSQTEVIQGKVYAVSHDGDVKIKRVIYDDDPGEVTRFYLASDNPRFQRERVKFGDSFTVIGRVIWRASEVF